jgi:hypothetical protein
MKLSSYRLYGVAVHADDTVLFITAVVMHMASFPNAGKQRSEGKQAN